MSIRLRLLLATSLVALVALVAADVLLYASLRSYLFGQIDHGLELSHRSVEASISTNEHSEGTGESSTGRPEPSGDTGSATKSRTNICPTFDGEQVDIGGLTPGTVLEVRNASDVTVWRCTVLELGSAQVVPPKLPGRITGYSPASGGDHEKRVYFNATAVRGDQEYRVRASVLRSGPDAGGSLVLAVPVSGTDVTLGTLRDEEVVVTAGALAVALILGWLLVRTSLHPLRDIERTADAITAGQLTERVSDDAARTEVGRLGRAFNVMLERIEAAFAQRDRIESDLRASEERMRRFISDASHELRTPLAAVSAYAELFDRGAADRPEDLRRVLHGIQIESRRMGQLVEDLLLLARLDEGRSLHVEPVDLAAAAAESVAAARTIGPQWPVALDAPAPVRIEGDELRIRQVIDNLLANVRVHTPLGTEATVTVRAEETVATVAVSDNGPGMDEADVQRIFERFFRADPSRSRLHGGAGLGLAIVDALVRSHRGTVEVSSATGVGTTFIVMLPLVHPPGAEPEPGPTRPWDGSPPPDERFPGPWDVPS